MKEFLVNLDWMTLLSAIWTVILVPIGTQIYKYLKTKKLDKYALILYREVKNAVKSVYETEVKDIKGTDAWTKDKMNEVKEIAKQKASIEKELKSEVQNRKQFRHLISQYINVSKRLIVISRII